jgi:hypothetical protein
MASKILKHSPKESDQKFNLVVMLQYRPSACFVIVGSRRVLASYSQAGCIVFLLRYFGKVSNLGTWSFQPISFEQPSRASLEEGHLSTLIPHHVRILRDVLRPPPILWGTQRHFIVPPRTTGSVGDGKPCLRIQHTRPLQCRLTNRICTHH